MYAAVVALRDSLFNKDSGALLFVVRTSVASFLLLELVLFPVNLFHLADLPDTTAESALSIIVLYLVVAPLIENLILVGAIEILDGYGLRRRSTVLVTASIAAVLHGWSGNWQFVSGLAFATMTYSYLLYRKERFVKRFLIIVAQHMLFNTPATLLMLWAE